MTEERSSTEEITIIASRLAISSWFRIGITVQLKRMAIYEGRKEAWKPVRIGPEWLKETPSTVHKSSYT